MHKKAVIRSIDEDACFAFALAIAGSAELISVSFAKIPAMGFRESLAPVWNRWNVSIVEVDGNPSKQPFRHAHCSLSIDCTYCRLSTSLACLGEDFHLDTST